MCRPLSILLLVSALPLHAQQAFQDSLRGLADDMAQRIVANGHPTVALLPITDPDGRPNEIGDQVGGELMYHLLAGNHGLAWVERSALDLVLDEQRLHASGLTRDGGTIAMGELKEAAVLVTGTVFPHSLGSVLLELKLLNTNKGTVEGMWRMVFPVPEVLHRIEQQQARDRERAEKQAQRETRRAERKAEKTLHDWRMGVAVVNTHYFGRWNLGTAIDLRRETRLSLGLRVQWDPLRGPVPNQVEFGHFTAGEGSFLFDDPYDGVLTGEGGEVYMVPAHDHSFGSRLLAEAMGQGATTATWSQVRAISINAQRFSVMLPLRLRLARDNAGIRPYIEVGYGLDVVTMRNRYEGVSLHVERTGYGTYSSTPGSMGSSAAAFSGADNNFLAWNMLLGSGVEVGRFTIGLEWRHAFHARTFHTGESRKVKGDPVGIALLNGNALEEGAILDELSRHGALQLGRITDHSFAGHKTSMERFLDRSHFQVGLSFKLF